MNETKLREALEKDFEKLYVKEFTTDWKVQRIVRSIEIHIMSLENTLKVVQNANLKEETSEVN